MYRAASNDSTSGVSHRNRGAPEFPEQFESALNVVDVVSFDLFDTLVHRRDLFSPKDLFYCVPTAAANHLSVRLDDFASVRVRAEETAMARQAKSICHLLMARPSSTVLSTALF